MQVDITYKIMEQDDDGYRTVVGQHTVTQEHPSEQAAQDACFAMCRTMFPDTPTATREYYVSAEASRVQRPVCSVGDDEIAAAHREEPIQHTEHA